MENLSRQKQNLHQRIPMVLSKSSSLLMEAHWLGHDVVVF